MGTSKKKGIREVEGMNGKKESEISHTS